MISSTNTRISIFKQGNHHVGKIEIQWKPAYKYLVIKEPTGWIWHLNTQKYKNLFSLAKKNRFLYKKITPILMVKSPDFNCVRKFWQNVIVYMYILYASIFVVENTSAKALCISVSANGYITTTSEK